jgi:ribosomal protein S18 acetylase RimI-like enzyme
MRVETARVQDYGRWLDLATEVESMFGPLRDNPAFQRALLANIERGTAFCVREQDGPPGARLLGGLLLSPARSDRPEYRIGWLAVGKAWRCRGIGQMLVEHALDLAEPSAPISVVTFWDNSEASRVASRFYERLGFQPAEEAAPGPEGGVRRVFRRGES